MEKVPLSGGASPHRPLQGVPPSSLKVIKYLKRVIIGSSTLLRTGTSENDHGYPNEGIDKLINDFYSMVNRGKIPNDPSEKNIRMTSRSDALVQSFLRLIGIRQ